MDDLFSVGLKSFSEEWPGLQHNWPVQGDNLNANVHDYPNVNPKDQGQPWGQLTHREGLKGQCSQIKFLASWLLPHANEVWDKVMFCTCLSVHGVGRFSVTSCLAAWCHVPSRSLCFWPHLPSRGALTRGRRVLCPGGRGLCMQTPWNQKNRRYASYWNTFL